MPPSRLVIAESACPVRACRLGGFTLIETLAVLAIVGILAGIALPKLTLAMEKAKVVTAIGDIKAIQTDLQAIEAQDQSLPFDLNAIGRGSRLDPWGRPYQYLRYDLSKKNPPGARKDKFLKPINSSFDLYSLGPDGKTSTNLNAKASLDDVVRANDGGFIGLAAKF